MSDQQSVNRILDKIAYGSGAVLQPLSEDFLYRSNDLLDHHSWTLAKPTQRLKVEVLRNE